MLTAQLTLSPPRTRSRSPSRFADAVAVPDAVHGPGLLTMLGGAAVGCRSGILRNGTCFGRTAR